MIVSKYTKRRGMSLLPTNIFRRLLQVALYRRVSPPFKKFLGTKRRTVDPLPYLPQLFRELTSTDRGLPEESKMWCRLRGSERTAALAR